MGERTTVPGGRPGSAGAAAAADALVAAGEGAAAGAATKGDGAATICGAIAPAVGKRDRRTTSSPSLISSSDRLDSSRSSISFLTFLRSMSVSLCTDGGSSAGQPLDRGVQRIAVTVRAETGDDAQRQVGKIRLATERFARVRVGKVDFDERNRRGGQRVAQCHRSVGEGGRVDQDERGRVPLGGVYPIDQFVLGIRLVTGQRVARRFGLARQSGVDVAQRGAAIHLRLAIAEQVEVGAVKGQNLRHASAEPAAGTEAAKSEL